MTRRLEHLVHEKQLKEWGLVNLKRKRLEVGVLFVPSSACQVVTEKIVLETHSPVTRGNRHKLQQGKNNMLLKTGC